MKQLTASTVGQQTKQNARHQRQLLRHYCEACWTTRYSTGGKLDYVIYSRLRRATKLNTKLQAIPDLLRLMARTAPYSSLHKLFVYLPLLPSSFSFFPTSSPFSSLISASSFHPPSSLYRDFGFQVRAGFSENWY